jgi:hypothetical protein
MHDPPRFFNSLPGWRRGRFRPIFSPDPGAVHTARSVGSRPSYQEVDAMKTRFSFAIPVLAFVVLLATPVVAQEVDAEKEKAEAKPAEMVPEAGEMAEGEGCDCTCVQEMHEKMMEARAEGEGDEAMQEMHEQMQKAHAEGEEHEAMEGDEAHAGMMKMLEACQCTRDEAMECAKRDADDDGDAVPETEETPDTEEDGDN